MYEKNVNDQCQLFIASEEEKKNIKYKKQTNKQRLEITQNGHKRHVKKHKRD